MSSQGQKIYLVSGKRTPFGKFGGSLGAITPVDLGVYASKALLEETGIKPDQIDHVIFGNVVTASTDTMYAGRHLALKLGCPEETPGYVVNRLCGSGVQIMLDAVRMIKLGEADNILCCGAENMTMIPHLVYGSRFGTKYGPLKTVDMLLDTLTDKFACIAMGDTAENLATEYNVTREESDTFSFQSHQKAVAAYEKGYLQKEITPIELKRSTCEKDEHLRDDASLESMAKLRPTFQKEGVVTAGSASGIVDGASAVMIASEKFVKDNNLKPIAEIIDGAVVGVDPKKMGIGPVPAIKKILERNSLSLDNIDLVEINEAFAAQTIACAKALELDQSKLNVWGGAVALGHPLAASGTRIAYTVARQLQELGKDLGIASACIGGGQGIAVLLKRV